MKRALSLALLALPLAALACGGSTTDTSSTSDGGTSDAGPGDASVRDSGAAAAGDDGGTTPLVPDDATIKFTSKGGFAPQGSDTAICTLEDETYTFEIATGHLTWKVCEFADGGPNDFATGTRDIAATDAAALRTALAAVKITTKLAGGADKPEEVLEVTTPSALTPSVYYDDFYHFQDDGKTYVSGLDGVLSELIKLSVHPVK